MHKLCSLSFLEDNALLKRHIDIEFESFLLEFLDHGDIRLFKVANAEFEYFELSPELLK